MPGSVQASPWNRNDCHLVQPRYQQVAHLPAMVEVDIHGLKEFVNQYNFVQIIMKGDVSLAGGTAGAGAPGVGVGP